jgi:hypothetical protein
VQQVALCWILHKSRCLGGTSQLRLKAQIPEHHLRPFGECLSLLILFHAVLNSKGFARNKLNRLLRGLWFIDGLAPSRLDSISGMLEHANNPYPSTTTTTRVKYTNTPRNSHISAEYRRKPKES